MHILSKFSISVNTKDRDVRCIVNVVYIWELCSSLNDVWYILGHVWHTLFLMRRNIFFYILYVRHLNNAKWNMLKYIANK